MFISKQKILIALLVLLIVPLVSAATLDAWDSSDSQASYMNSTTIYANFTDMGVPINDTSCSVFQNQTDTWIPYNNLTYNSSSQLYEIIADNSYFAYHGVALPQGIYTLNITCNDTSILEIINVSNHPTTLIFSNNTVTPEIGQVIEFYANYSSPVFSLGNGSEISDLLWETPDLGSTGGFLGIFDYQEDGFLNDVAISVSDGGYKIKTYSQLPTIISSLTGPGSVTNWLESVTSFASVIKKLFFSLDTAGEINVYNSSASIFSVDIGPAMYAGKSVDLDNDGIDEGIVARTSTTIYFYNRTSDTSWSQGWSQSSISTCHTYSYCEVKVLDDLDNDGYDDVVASAYDRAIEVFSGRNGSRIFGINLTGYAGVTPSFGIGDINNDGLVQEIVVASHSNNIQGFVWDGTVGVWLTESNSTFTVGVNPGTFPSETIEADLDNDGFIDEWVIGGAEGTVFFLNNTGGIFAQQSGLGVITTITIDDLEGDGNKEVFVGGNAEIVYVFNNTGANTRNITIGKGPIGELNENPGGGYSMGIRVVDMNKDGLKELIVVSTENGDDNIYLTAMNTFPECSMSFNDSVTVNMTWDVNERKWIYARVFNEDIPYSFNVTCSMQGYETQTASSQILSFVSDVSSPTIEYLSPGNATYVSSGNINFTFNGTDYNNITNATLYANFTGVFIANTSIAGINNGVSGILASNVVDGVYVWNIYSCDTVGNCGFNESNQTVFVDGTAPNITLLSPVDTSIINSSMVEFVFTAADDILDNVSLYTNQSGVFEAVQTRINPNATGVNRIREVDYVNTNYVWNIYACDENDNCGFAVANRTVTLNRTKPQKTFQDWQEEYRSPIIPITLYPDDNLSTNTSYRVAFAVPFPKDKLTSLDNISLWNASQQEVPIYIESLGYWKNLTDNLSSHRSVYLQFNHTINSSITNATYYIHYNSTRETTDLSEIPYSSTLQLVTGPEYTIRPYEGVIYYNASHTVYEPKIYVGISPAWLVRSQLFPPLIEENDRTKGSELAEQKQDFFNSSINDVRSHVSLANQIDFIEDYEPWLYDRSSVFYEMYITTGELKFLREAYRSTDYYMQQLDSSDGFILKSSPDLKYVYAQSPAIHYWLTGDPDSITAIQDAFTFGQGSGGHDVNYSRTDNFWTERHSAYQILIDLFAYEVLGSSAAQAQLEEDINEILYVQQTPQFENEDNLGAFKHDLTAHEGSGGTNISISSPWMSSILTNSLLNYYYLYNDSRIPESVYEYSLFTMNYGDWPGEETTNNSEASCTPEYNIVWYVNAQNSYPLTATLTYYLVHTPNQSVISCGDAGRSSNYEHNSQIAYLLETGAHLAHQNNWPYAQNLTTLANEYYNITIDRIFPYWIRTGAGTMADNLTFWRLNPPRKFSWWFGEAMHYTYFADERFHNQCFNESATRSCGTNVGICSTGTQTCTNGYWSACSGAVEPNSTEICNDGFDGLCNGDFDEICLYSSTSENDTSAPTTTLSTPADASNISVTNVTFIFTSTHDNITNATLYTNASGSFIANQTNTTLTSGNPARLFLEDLNNGTYLWNIYACNSFGNCSFATTNRTFTIQNYTIDAVAPGITQNHTIPVSSTSFRLRFLLNESGNVSLSYSAQGNASVLTVTNTTRKLLHIFRLASLSQNTVYEYNITFCDADANCNEQTNLNFTTYRPRIELDWDAWHFNTTTRFHQYNNSALANLSNVTLRNNFGRITFLNALNLSQNRTLTGAVTATQNSISINSSSVPEFNTSAIVEVYGINFTVTGVLRDSIVCTATYCSNVSQSGETVTFNVTQFSAYEVYGCGDGEKNGAEECDGSDFGSESCSTQGFDSGSLSCSASCTIVTSACSSASSGSSGGGGGGGGGGALSFLFGDDEETSEEILEEEIVQEPLQEEEQEQEKTSIFFNEETLAATNNEQSTSVEKTQEQPTLIEKTQMDSVLVTTGVSLIIFVFATIITSSVILSRRAHHKKMATHEDDPYHRLHKYIRAMLEKKHSQESIKNQLLKHGWDKAVVELEIERTKKLLEK